MIQQNKIELVCPAGTPTSLETAIESGADSVYVGFSNETNARNYPGLNFNFDELKQAVRYVKQKQKMIFVAINTNPKAGKTHIWKEAVDNAVAAGVTAIIISDLGLLEYASKKHPDFRIHLSVQAFASTAEAINFYQKEFGIKRVVIPRIFTLREIQNIISKTTVEIEVFAFAVAGPMAEGRCILSSYVTGKSPNNYGACSPAECVKYQEQGDITSVRLNDILINQFGKTEFASYPTLCRGRYIVNDKPKYLFESPASLNGIELLPKLQEIGVKAVKIEGRQRGKSYVKDITQAFRGAIDSISGEQSKLTNDDLNADIAGLCEGQQNILGAFQKKWL